MPATKNQTDILERTRKLMTQLPELCFDFFLDMEPRTSPLTRMNYAYDLRTFFTYLHEHIYGFDMPIPSYTIEQIGRIQARHLNLYMEYLNQYSVNGEIRQNGNSGKKRKIMAIKSFFRFLYRNGYTQANVSELITSPKIQEKPIIRLEENEMQDLLEIVEDVEHQPAFTKRQIQYQEHTKVRDNAIISLLLGTGMRVSECTGIDLDDIDWQNQRIRILRKGGNEEILYYSHDVSAVLLEYAAQRNEISPMPGHEKAFFLSLQNKRISNRSVELLVKKYASAAVPVKKITPHKLRSTYGTRLYQKTGDIYLVADVLGHKDVNITKRYYAAMSDEKRRMAAELSQLHPDKDSEKN